MKKILALLLFPLVSLAQTNSGIQVRNLPAGSAVSGPNLVICDQSGSTYVCTVDQLATYINGQLRNIPLTAITTTISGVLKGNGTGVVAAAATDITSLFGGTCSSVTFLRGDGTCVANGSGSVTNTSVVLANGFSGSVANPTTTPAITLSTTITGPLKGNGTALQAASASDISGLWGCSAGQALGPSGACVTPSSSIEQLVLQASGDTTGVTDRANFAAAMTTLAASARLPPGGSQSSPLYVIKFGPGTFYFNTGNILLGSATTKLQGLWIQCSGRGVTVIYYNPATAAPLFINNHGLDVKFTDCTFQGNSAASDFLWSQEQAGLSNVQDYTFQDVEWQGSWQYIDRLTGGNNNSEWKHERDTVAAQVTGWIYVPPKVATTITMGSSVIAATNTAEQVQVGDTGFFSAACAPLAANTQYYVVAANTSNFSVSTTSGGAATSFTANCTPNFQTGSDQFLNFWFSKVKFNTATSLGQWLILNFGGSVKIYDSDASEHSPTSTSYLFNLLGSTHAYGVQNFEADGLRIEHGSAYSRTMLSQWAGGSISFNNLDESSQQGMWSASNAYAVYQIVNVTGPTIKYSNSQLMGTHSYVVYSSDYGYQSAVNYDTVTLLETPTFANFIVMSGTNTGGYPIINCDYCKNQNLATTVGYQEILDTSLNWQYSEGKGAVKTRSVSCLGPQSGWPVSSGNLEFRLPLNAAITGFRFWKPANGNTGAFQYTVQTTEGTPTVLAGGASTPLAGTNAGALIPLYTTFGASTPFVMGTDTARTINILDTLGGGRTGLFSGVYCLIDYIG